MFRHLTIKGTLVGTIKDTEKVLEFAKQVGSWQVLRYFSSGVVDHHLKQGLLKPVCEVWPIDKLPEAVQKLKKGGIAGRCVVNFNA